MRPQIFTCSSRSFSNNHNGYRSYSMKYFLPHISPGHVVQCRAWVLKCELDKPGSTGKLKPRTVSNLHENTQLFILCGDPHTCMGQSCMSTAFQGTMRICV
jgi:hypothetical protein